MEHLHVDELQMIDRYFADLERQHKEAQRAARG